MFSQWSSTALVDVATAPAIRIVCNSDALEVREDSSPYKYNEKQVNHTLIAEEGHFMMADSSLDDWPQHTSLLLPSDVATAPRGNARPSRQRAPVTLP